MTFYVSRFVLFVFLPLSETVKNIHVGLVVAGFDLAFMLVISANLQGEIVSFVRVARGRTFPLLFPHLLFAISPFALLGTFISICGNAR